MKKIIIILILVSIIALIGCSGISQEYMDKFCEERDMQFYDDWSGSFKCKIRTTDYIALKTNSTSEELYGF